MVDFGWSYPPGCSGTPYDEIEYCLVCGKSEYDCDCPECPQCGEIGDLDCYRVHGMIDPKPIKFLRHLCDAIGIHVDITDCSGNGDEHRIAALDKAVFKGTECGAWVQYWGGDPNDPSRWMGGVAIGSIIEGYDACTSTHIVWFPCAINDFWEAVQAVSDEADDIWNELQAMEEDDDYANL